MKNMNDASLNFIHPSTDFYIISSPAKESPKECPRRYCKVGICEQFNWTSQPKHNWANRGRQFVFASSGKFRFLKQDLASLLSNIYHSYLRIDVFSQYISYKHSVLVLYIYMFLLLIDLN